ncbi:MAG: hypothetical protein ACD_19C00410G0001 [uncultured bacterium]|nr:MAG: hypothetical protein ACD_19C00410G0001 [uncultured bacterium]
MANSLLVILALELMFIPLIPNSAEKISEMINVKPIKWPKGKTTEYLKKLIKNISIRNIKPLFSKIDESVIEIEKNKINLTE